MLYVHEELLMNSYFVVFKDTFYCLYTKVHLTNIAYLENRVFLCMYF